MASVVAASRAAGAIAGTSVSRSSTPGSRASAACAGCERRTGVTMRLNDPLRINSLMRASPTDPDAPRTTAAGELDMTLHPPIIRASLVGVSALPVAEQGSSQPEHTPVHHDFEGP